MEIDIKANIDTNHFPVKVTAIVKRKAEKPTNSTKNIKFEKANQEQFQVFNLAIKQEQEILKDSNQIKLINLSVLWFTKSF